MIAMIFEYHLDPDRPEIHEEYLAESARVRDVVAGLEGFRGVERFESCATPGRYVALGFFDDEAAVTRWRIRPEHRRAQALGRRRFFTDYRLRMAEVVRDYGPSERAEAPRDSRRAHG